LKRVGRLLRITFHFHLLPRKSSRQKSFTFQIGVQDTVDEVFLCDKMVFHEKKAFNIVRSVAVERDDSIKSMLIFAVQGFDIKRNGNCKAGAKGSRFRLCSHAQLNHLFS
jgi:hypothetical protein